MLQFKKGTLRTTLSNKTAQKLTLEAIFKYSKGYSFVYIYRN